MEEARNRNSGNGVEEKDETCEFKQWLNKRRCSVIERQHFDRSIIKEKPLLWIMGPTGSGKGTQCNKLHARYGFTHISSGELMRYEVLEGTDRSNMLGELMKNGKPISNSIVLDVMAQAIVTLAKESTGFIIDGFPLDEEQADEFVNEFGPPSLVLYFNCSNRVLRERLTERNNFDDNAEAISNRFKQWSERTKDVLEKYNAIPINAVKSKEEVFSEIEALLKEKFNLTPQIADSEEAISSSRKNSECV